MPSTQYPTPNTQPRILFVTPEVAFVPERTGSHTYCIGACSGCFGDFPAELINDLLNLGVDVHVAQPDYRKIFAMLSHNKQANPSIKLSIDQVYLAEDRVFFYSNPIYHNSEGENIKISISFQREVINQIVPRIQPDLIHCHDWMTGLIPAVAKEYEIPCLFTVQNPDSAKSLLSDVENKGIDAAAFWRRLFYDRFPGNYEDTRDTNPLDFLLSGILAAQYVETVNFPLLANTAKGRCKNFYACLRQVLAGKFDAGCVCGMAGTPEPPVNATRDEKLFCKNGPIQQHAGEQRAERALRRSAPSFNHCAMAYHYVELYERILQRPLVTPEKKMVRTINRNGHTKGSGLQAYTYGKESNTKSYALSNEQISTPAMAPI